jgi:thioredoxin reductase (NADPH)
MEHWDVIIVGAGPAGLCAGIYCGRARLRTLVLDKLAPGGALLITDAVEDYPGFDRISGTELAERMEAQARKFGAEFRVAEVKQIAVNGTKKVVTTEDETLTTDVVIITSGSSAHRLGVPGEARFLGRGVSTCALCDGAFFQNEVIAVVGGGDSALKEALFLTRFASRIHLVHRRDQFRAQKNWQDKVRAHPKIELVLDSVVEEILGEATVSGIRVRNLKTGLDRQLPVSGVFVFIGSQPNTYFAKDHLEHDASGYLVTDADMATAVPGIYVAGDVRSQLTRQISNAVGDATVASVAAEHYLEHLRGGA